MKLTTKQKERKVWWGWGAVLLSKNILCLLKKKIYISVPSTFSHTHFIFPIYFAIVFPILLPALSHPPPSGPHFTDLNYYGLRSVANRRALLVIYYFIFYSPLENNCYWIKLIRLNSLIGFLWLFVSTWITISWKPCKKGFSISKASLTGCKKNSSLARNISFLLGKYKSNALANHSKV